MIDFDSPSDYFLIVPPGFEEAAKIELGYWLGRLENPVETEIEIEHGGLNVRCPIELGMSLNFCLKIPVRILWRLSEFRCKDFQKLYKKIAKLKWNQVIGGADLEWHATSRSSRVKIKDRIETTCADAFAKYRKGNSPPKELVESVFRIHVRFNDDTCTLSMDTSGEALFKRGFKKNVGKAPIRENLAAGILWNLIDLGKKRDVGTTLIDPAVGSGTFLLEGFYLSESLSCDSAKLLLSKLKKEVVSFTEGKSFFNRFFGFDKSLEALEVAGGNLAGIQATIAERDFYSTKKIEGLDSSPENWVVINPPYNHRISLSWEKTPFNRMFDAVQGSIKPNRMAMIVPKDHLQEFLKLLKVEPAKRIAFSNGGIAVEVLFF